MANRATPEGILFTASGGLGDAVLLAHVFPRFAQLAQPGERVTLVLRRDARKMGFLFAGLANIETVDYDRYSKSFWYRRSIKKRLGAQPWRMIVSLDHLRHPKRDEALIKALPAAEKIAMHPRSWAKYDADLACNEKNYARLFASGPDHLDKVVRWARFADWLTGTHAVPPKLVLPAERLPQAATATTPFAILIPFSAVREKQVRPDLFAAIARQLAATQDIVIAGAPDDLARNPEYAPLLTLPRVRFEACDFESLARMMRAAACVISVDTAAMHLAVAVGAPTLCLASAAYVGEIVPYADAIAPPNVRFIYTPMDCAGCLGVCILPSEQTVYPCVARLSQDAVLAILERMTTPMEHTA
jgi:ADP-heptose:LPS heptosyltransferase